MTLPPCRYTETLSVPCDLGATVLVEPAAPALPSTGAEVGLVAVALIVVTVGAALRSIARGRPRQPTSS